MVHLAVSSVVPCFILWIIGAQQRMLYVVTDSEHLFAILDLFGFAFLWGTLHCNADSIRDRYIIYEAISIWKAPANRDYFRSVAVLSSVQLDGATDWNHPVFPTSQILKKGMDFPTERMYNRGTIIERIYTDAVS